MPRKKAARNVEIKPWLSGNSDNREGRFIQVGNSFLLNQSVQKLSAGARCLYLCMAMESGGGRDVTFPRKSAKKYGIAESSFDRYTKELCENGFLTRIISESRDRCVPAEYRFCMEWKTVQRDTK